MKLVLIILFCLMAVEVGAQSPSYISSMSDYGIRALTGTYAPTNGNETMRSVKPADWLTDDNIIAPWSGGPYAISGTKLFVHGGGHGDSANNGMYVYDFSGTSAPTGWTLTIDYQFQSGQWRLQWDIRRWQAVCRPYL